MLTYVYTARDLRNGTKISAEVEAENEGAAARLLTERGLTPIDIKVKRELDLSGSFFKRVPRKQLVIFTRQLSTMINAGLPLVQSLNTVRDQTSNKTLKAIISRVTSGVEAGASLSNAMARYPRFFDEVYTSLVAAGEASGTLDVSLDRLANQQEKDSEMISRLRGAMLYPFIVVMVLTGVVIFLMTSVLPQVENLYAGLPDIQLPFVTRLLLGATHFIISFWWLILLLLGGGLFLAYRWIRTPKGRAFVDSLKMRSPGFGPLFMKLYMARFARVAATLVGSGVPLLQVLNTSAKSIGNVHIAAAIDRATEQVRGGKNLSEGLSGNKYFLELVPSMIRIGEQSGSLDQMLSKLADYYEKEVDNQIKSISTVVEPILLITVGIIALIVVAAVLLPIYSLAGKNFIRI